jgi:transcriptional regulator with XRE-family HTH domain
MKEECVMSDFEKKLAKDLARGKEYREAYAEAFANEYLATQIQIIRKKNGLTQAQLGERIGSNQGRISVYEDEEYGKWSLETLRKIASEFGLWPKISFESYSTLVHEVTHFRPESLLRSPFEEDGEMRRWIEEDGSAEGFALAQRQVGAWASQQGDRSELIAWLQGFKLPGFNVRETTPAQYLLQLIPERNNSTWNHVVQQVASLIGIDFAEVQPLVRNLPVYLDNLFGLAASIGPRASLQEALQSAYEHALLRYEKEGHTGLGYDGESGLVGAMIRNQVDERWKQLWFSFLTGGNQASDLTTRAHPFLPGTEETGVRGLLALPLSASYWRTIAEGVRDLERRFTLHGRAGVEDTPNVMDALETAVAVIFDSWADPRAAQDLMRGSLALMATGSWFMFASAAWAYGIHRRGWNEAVWSSSDLEHREFADTLASGLQWYKDWQLARQMRGSGLRDIQSESDSASWEVIREAA